MRRLLALIILTLGARCAAAQGLEPLLPDPIRTQELDDLVGDRCPECWPAIEALHDAYLSQWRRDVFEPSLPVIPAACLEYATLEDIDRIRRIASTMGRLEAALLEEVGAVLGLQPSAVDDIIARRAARRLFRTIGRTTSLERRSDRLADALRAAIRDDERRTVLEPLLAAHDRRELLLANAVVERGFAMCEAVARARLPFRPTGLAPVFGPLVRLSESAAIAAASPFHDELRRTRIELVRAERVLYRAVVDDIPAVLRRVLRARLDRTAEIPLGNFEPLRVELVFRLVFESPMLTADQRIEGERLYRAFAARDEELAAIEDERIAAGDDAGAYEAMLARNGEAVQVLFSRQGFAAPPMTWLSDEWQERLLCGEFEDRPDPWDPAHGRTTPAAVLPPRFLCFYEYPWPPIRKDRLDRLLARADPTPAQRLAAETLHDAFESLRASLREWGSHDASGAPLDEAFFLALSRILDAPLRPDVADAIAAAALRRRLESLHPIDLAYRSAEPTDPIVVIDALDLPQEIERGLLSAVLDRSAEIFAIAERRLEAMERLDHHRHSWTRVFVEQRSPAPDDEPTTGEAPTEHDEALRRALLTDAARTVEALDALRLEERSMRSLATEILSILPEAERDEALILYDRSAWPDLGALALPRRSADPIALRSAAIAEHRQRRIERLLAIGARRTSPVDRRAYTPERITVEPVSLDPIGDRLDAALRFEIEELDARLAARLRRLPSTP